MKKIDKLKVWIYEKLIHYIGTSTYDSTHSIYALEGELLKRIVNDEHPNNFKYEAINDCAVLELNIPIVIPTKERRRNSFGEYLYNKIDSIRYTPERKKSEKVDKATTETLEALAMKINKSPNSKYKK